MSAIPLAMLHLDGQNRPTNGIIDRCRALATLFNISKSTAWKVTHSVSNTIVEAMLDEYVRLPAGERKARIIAKFHQICGLDNVVGALDGCHIPILCPSVGCKSDYTNRKCGTS